MTRLASVCTLALAALAGLTSPAAADLPAPAPNGTIIFASGRDDGATPFDNVTSQLWTIAGPGGTATRRTANTTEHHRHPAWSPDHTKIAYAAGTGFTGAWDIWVRDVTQPISLVNPRNITQSALSEDRPAWSPDGTRIVYQQGNEFPTTVNTNVNIQVRAADGTGTETTVAVNVEPGMAGASSFFPRPHWTPDSQTIFYAQLAGPGNHDIRSAPANGSDPDGTGVLTDANDDYQPYVSPDGTKLCFTRDDADKDVFVSTVAGALPGALLPDNTLDEYECAWSPDQTKVLVVRGAGDNGLVLMRNSDGTGPVDTVADQPVGQTATFDGNPDWAMNPSPICQNVPASVDFNSFVSISLSCADVPEPFQSQPEEVALEIATPPSNGALGALDDDGRVLYTPNVNFQGTDTFTYTGSDQTSTSTPATVTVTVRGRGVDGTASDITDVSVFPRVWRRGSGLPSFSARKGTRIQWRLSEAARVTLTFQRARPGRRVRGRCVRPTRARRARPRCTRFVSVRPSLTRANAAAGLNTLRFQGRLSSRKRLPLGTYRVVVGAVDAAGNRSASERSRTFRIVAR